MKSVEVHRADALPAAVVAAGVAIAFVPFFVPLDWPALLLVLVLSFAARSIAPVHQHCHAHRRLFRGAVANRAYDIVLMLAGGNTTAVWELQHVRGHHRFLMDKRRDPADTERFGGRGPFRRLRFTLLGDALSVFDAYRIARAERNAARWLRRLWTDLGIQLGVLTALAAWDLRNTLALFVLPAMLLRWAIFWFSFSQHDGARGTDVYGRAITHFGWTNRLFLNVGHHVAHHEKPTLHWSLLPYRTRQILHRIPEQCLR